jgi:hypothetical protein
VTRIRTIQSSPKGLIGGGGDSGGAGEKKATWGILRKFRTGDLSLVPNYYIAKSSGTFTDLAIKCYQPPISSDDSVTTLDIQISSDDGATWRSIFPPGGFILDASGLTQTITTFAVATINGYKGAAREGEPRDIMRIACLSTANVEIGYGIELVLSWD